MLIGARGDQAAILLQVLDDVLVRILEEKATQSWPRHQNQGLDIYSNGIHRKIKGLKVLYCAFPLSFSV